MKISSVALRAGQFFVAISLLFLVAGLWKQKAWLSACQPSMVDIFLMLAAICSYGSSQFLLSYAWFRLLAIWSITAPLKTDCYQVYGHTQIAKYIPGNFLHYVGRHIGARKFGSGHQQLILASFLETIGVIFAAALLGFIGLMLFYEQQSISSLIGMLSFVVLTVFTTIAVFKLMPLAARRLGRQLPDRTPADVIPVILVTFFCYLLFFFHAGVLTLAVTLKFDADLSLEHAGGVLTAFSVSWIAGFLTPGSPGGIGVREATFVASLSSFIEERHALVIAIVMRIITSGGDLAFYFMTKTHGNSR